MRNFFAARMGRRPYIAGERLYLAMRDGSGDRLAALLTHAGQNDRPLVVLLHGLTGCETSMNMARAAACHLARGYPVLRLNLRGAGPSRPTCRGDYHAGCSRDLADALTSLGEHEPALVARGLLLSGVSLGANAMIKFLAEYGGEFPIRAAVSVSAPIDLALSCRSLMRRRNAPYHRWLLHRMKLDCQGSEMNGCARAALAQARTVYEFDDTYVEANFNVGAGPVSYEFSIGQYENFTGPTLDYFISAVTLEHEGFYGTVGGFGSALTGKYGEVGYGFSAADLDLTIAGILNDSDASGLFDSAGLPTPGMTLFFGIGKTFEF